MGGPPGFEPVYYGRHRYSIGRNRLEEVRMGPLHGSSFRPSLFTWRCHALNAEAIIEGTS